MSKLVPFKEGILSEPLSPLDDVRLEGVRCNSCGAMSLGVRRFCINCSGSDVAKHTFSKDGQVYMHTIIRHPPPPPYPKDNFKPFPAAWIRLEEGLFVLSQLTDIGLEDVEAGMKVEMFAQKGWEDDEGNDVIMYRFRPKR